MTDFQKAQIICAESLEPGHTVGTLQSSVIQGDLGHGIFKGLVTLRGHIFQDKLSQIANGIHKNIQISL